MDEFKVQMFNMTRKNSTNICAAISNEEQDLEFYCSRVYSPVNTLNKDFAESMEAEKPGRNYALKKIRSRKLDSILAETQFSKTEIDVLSIDVEGHELPVLESLNFETYKPKVLVVEIHAETIEEILSSELYKYIKNQKYSLFCWIKPSLIFARDGSITGYTIV